jgi:hypothetical protein
MFAITFENGQPTHPASSKTAVIPILSSKNLPSGPVPPRADRANAADCPGCIRPAGVTFDSRGNLLMASASSGEIFVITRDDGKPMSATTAKELEALEKSHTIPVPPKPKAQKN